MDAIIDIRGSDLRCLGVAGGNEYRIDALDAISALRGFANRYERVLKNLEAQLALGRNMYTWLNANGWMSHWLAQAGARRLSIQLTIADASSALGLALLDAPWEVLAEPDGSFLALDGVQPFLILRRVGVPDAPWVPKHANLALLFMAAAPKGEHELDFEAEEAAILGATEKTRVQLHVEETGSLEGLTYRISQDGPFEAVHLTCHGTQDPTLGAALAFEDEVGDCALADPAMLVTSLGDLTQLPFAFVSACQTAEQVEGADGFPLESFTRALVRAGVANVLGWDGSVRDADAVLFAESLYAGLSLGWDLPKAVAQARLGLLQAHMVERDKGDKGAHWHLARLYLGPAGGGALVNNKKRLRTGLANQVHTQQFLDEGHAQVPVASQAAFVGRRREIQQALGLLQDAHTAGVLIQGMGNLGKSSLAARIASRLTGHRTVVVFGRYDASTIFERILAAIPASLRSPYRSTWQATLDADESALADALEALLLEPDLQEQPILLVVDDLERILEQPAPGQSLTPVQRSHAKALTAVLQAFRQARARSGASCLLITSRYRFMLPDRRGQNLADALGLLPLRPMSPRERQKQTQAAVRLATLSVLDSAQQALVREARELAAGNPGLQDVLTKPILAGELDAAHSAQNAIRHFMAQGIPGQDQQQLLDFFERMSFEHYTQALQPQERRVLRTACVFSTGLPIPQRALEAAAHAQDPTPATPAIRRLLGLGLLDDWGRLESSNLAYLGINPLARPLVIHDPLDETPAAQAGLAVLLDDWKTADGRFPRSPRGVEMARLALLVPDLDASLGQSLADAAGRYLFNQAHDAQGALALIKPMLERNQHAPAALSFDLLAIADQCAERLGESALRAQVLDWMPGVAQSDKERAGCLFRKAGAIQTSNPKAAEAMLRQVLLKLEELGDVRSIAVTQGQIADILQARGQLDEALRIRTEQELPVYEKLGDVRSVTVAQGKIADILQARGQLYEALRIRIEQELPVYEKLGDVRARAITQGKIADILQARGQLDEALRIRTEQELPVYEKLGDVRLIAVTQGKIADILQARGQLDEALRIFTDQLPVYENLGDVRERAITQGKIADILQARGQLDEALVLHAQRLPVAQAMGDIESIAHIRFSMARLRLERGDLAQGVAALERIAAELGEAYGYAKELERPNFIGGIGFYWAQILTLLNQPQAAHEVCNEAEAAFRLLDDEAGVDAIQTLRQRIPS